MARPEIFDSSGHPATREAQHVAIALAGSTELVQLVAAPLRDDVFSELLQLCEHHRLLGSLADAIASQRFAVTADQFDSVSQRYLVWLSNALEVERLLVSVTEAFSAAGIESRVLKGVALAHLTYDTPSSRVFADLDLLVPAQQFDEAIRVARRDLGGVQMVAELRPGFDREFGKEATLQVGRVELDLHRTFVTGPFGLTIDLDRLFDEPTGFAVGGATVLAMNADNRFLHACYNAALGDFPPRLCSLRDLLLTFDRGEVHLQRARAQAIAWKATAVVRRAAMLTCETFQLPSIHGLWRLSLDVPSRREAFALRSYLHPARSYARPLASLLVIPGVRARARYARALVNPSADYLHSRGWTKGSHVRRAMHRLRGTDRG